MSEMINEFQVPVTDETPEGGVDTSPATIRAWAKENGYSVAERGRIKAEVRNAFLEEHGLLDTSEVWVLDTH